MKLPSVREVSAEANETLLRFPLVILDAVLFTAAALLIINHEGSAQPSVLFKVLFAGLVGVPFLTALALLVEKKDWTGIRRSGVQLAGVALLVYYGTTVPADTSANPMLIHVIRLLLLLVSGLFFVAVAPFHGKGESAGFWQYNKTLFVRFCISLVYSGVLFAGLALALAALDILFGVHIDVKRYPELWITIAGIFSVWFFLAGVPRNLSAPGAVSDYPKALRIFSQNVLFPILLVYLVILYSYVGKILFTWTWPKGWVSLLILIFATAGMLALMLLYPLRQRPEYRWYHIASRWFYVILIPLEVTLFLAFWTRVSEYGLTEGRYLGFVLAIWLAGVSVYYIIRKPENIRLVPVSLSIIAFLVSFGPWGAFSRSEASQLARLKGLFEKNSMLKDGKAVKAEMAIPPADAEQMVSIFRYLHETHGYDGLQAMFATSLRRDPANPVSWPLSPDDIAAELGVNYQNIWFNSQQNAVLNIAGYERLLPRQSVGTGWRTKAATGDIHATDIRWHSGTTGDTLTFIAMQSDVPVDSLHVQVRPLIRSLVERYGGPKGDVPPDAMIIENRNRHLMVKVCLDNLSVKGLGTSFTIESYDMQVMYTILNTP